uniref:Uncharacterized protein n=1 Tax=Salix viminalis TaxID=40686 RepID=A0A6N2LCH5_SALVM
MSVSRFSSASSTSKPSNRRTCFGGRCSQHAKKSSYGWSVVSNYFNPNMYHATQKPVNWKDRRELLSEVSKDITLYKCRMIDAACHVRSISLPSRSHPLNASVEDQLDRLRSSLTTSTSAYHKLSGLKAFEQQKERGEEVLNGSLLLLDMCSTTRDVFSSMKECLQELESSLRRRKGGESGFSSEVNLI